MSELDQKQISLAICICTYQREESLKAILLDILKQTQLPETICLVDGSPGGSKVQSLLNSLPQLKEFNIIYIPSNHANLSYQRYLGWRAVSQTNAEFMLYLDDDLRLVDLQTIEKLSRPFMDHMDIVGATVNFKMGNSSELIDVMHLYQTRKQSHRLADFVKLFQVGRYYEPGGITPVGDRLLPEVSEGEAFSSIQWLRGGVMFIRISALNRDCFDDGLFALTKYQCGLGEDTCLSRRLLSQGKLVLIQGLVVEHPDLTQPNSYPIKPYRHGFARAYSRRYINDQYRYPNSPRLSDRLFLIKFYIGNFVLNFIKAFGTFQKSYFLFAVGFALGALMGVFKKPNTSNLSPKIEWFSDADKAMVQMKTFSGDSSQ